MVHVYHKVGTQESNKFWPFFVHYTQPFSGRAFGPPYRLVSSALTG